MIKCYATSNSFMIDPQGYIRACCRYKTRLRGSSFGG